MTKPEMRKLADEIAATHGCEIAPTALEFPALVVLRQYSQGDPLDRQRTSRCFASLAAAGVNVHGWVS